MPRKINVELAADYSDGTIREKFLQVQATAVAAYDVGEGDLFKALRTIGHVVPAPGEQLERFIEGVTALLRESTRVLAIPGVTYEVEQSRETSGLEALLAALERYNDTDDTLEVPDADEVED